MRTVLAALGLLAGVTAAGAQAPMVLLPPGAGGPQTTTVPAPAIVPATPLDPATVPIPPRRPTLAATQPLATAPAPPPPAANPPSDITDLLSQPDDGAREKEQRSSWAWLLLTSWRKSCSPSTS